METSYRTVFEISQKGFDWWFPAAGLGFVVLGVVLIWMGKYLQGPRTSKWVGYAFVGFASLWTLVSFSTMYSEYHRLHRAYQTGRYSVVEGPVEYFRPMPWEGHQDECFSVKGVTFCYSDYGPTAGFNNSSSHGGPIRTGQHLRVGYVDDSIVKIDIREDQLPTAAVRKETETAEQSRSAERTQHDPQHDKMTLGFTLAAVFWTAWWNVSWQRFMKFWVQPPYRPITVILFRLFFAANLAGSISLLASQVLRQTRPTQAYLGAAAFGAAWIAVIFLMVHFVEWQARRYRRR